MYCEPRLAWVSTPNRISSAFSDCGVSSPWNLPIMASAGLPGISRGSRKLRVSATHSVSTKKPRRRSAYPKLVPLGSLSVRRAGPGERPCHPVARAVLPGLEVQQHLLVVRIGPYWRLRVRVARGGPSGEGRRVVLVPVHPFGDRDERHLGQHDLLELVDDGVLGRRAGRAGVLVEQGLGGGVAVTLVVGRGRLADRSRVGRVQPVVQLVVRAWADRLLFHVGELEVAGEQVGLVVGVGQVLGR